MSLKALKPVESVSTPVEVAETTETDTSLQPLSTNDLLKLVASMQQQVLISQQEAAKANAALASAILETTKPREALKTKRQIADEANEKHFIEQQRETERRKKANIAAEQKYCDHIAGCSQLGDERDLRGRTSILWHRNDVEVEIGVCTNCQRIFRPNEEDYPTWRRKPSINKLSTAGHRAIVNHDQAYDKSYLHDIE